MDNDAIKMRPRFSREFNLSEGDIQQVLRDIIEHQEGAVVGQHYDDHCVLRVESTKRELWSPQLCLDFRPAEDGNTVVLGRFEPHPSVWSGFMGAYTFSGFVAFIALCWAGGQWMADHSPTALWAVMGAIFIAVNTYAFSLFGRALGQEDMYKLRRIVDQAYDIHQRRVH